MLSTPPVSSQRPNPGEEGASSCVVALLLVVAVAVLVVLYLTGQIGPITTTL
jgi:hypothetical protein